METCKHMQTFSVKDFRVYQEGWLVSIAYTGTLHMRYSMSLLVYA